MIPVRALIADESPAMRRWYEAALQRIAADVEDCESGWDLLFNLAEDLFEEHDVAALHPERTARMSAALETWFEQVEADRAAIRDG